MASLADFPAIPALPVFRVLSNGDYRILLHGNGTAFSRYRQWALNDWVWDGLSGYGAVQIYAQDLDSGVVSRFDLGIAPAASQGCAVDVDQMQWCYQQDDWRLTVTLSLAQSFALEIRDLQLESLSHLDRRVALTVFVPIALNEPAVHDSHPAFSKLFVQTEFEGETLIAQRRPRGNTDPSPCMMARLLGPGELEWETDRIRFIGRGCSLAMPCGILDGLSRRKNNVLDPCFALQRRFDLKAGSHALLQWQMGAASTRNELNYLLQQQAPNCQRAAFGANPALETLLGAQYFRLPQLKPATEQWRELIAAQNNVWSFGVATDRPFLLLMTASEQQLRWAETAAGYWKELGLPLPLLVLGRNLPSSEQVQVRHLDQIPQADVLALQAAATMVCGELAPRAAASRSAQASALQIKQPRLNQSAQALDSLQFQNGLGGFSEDGTEYVMYLRTDGQRVYLPPMPWINVLANPTFGCLISETGAGCTWSVNSHERRLTAWANDPVRDQHEDAFYLHEPATGLTWSPLPGSMPGSAIYKVQHGWGYSVFATDCEQLHQQTQVFVPRNLPVKIWRVTLTNNSEQKRTLTLTLCQRLVLGFLPQQASHWITTEQRPAQRLLLARNPLGGELAQHMAFATAITEASWRGGCDRRALLGDSGDLTQPCGLSGEWQNTPAAGDAGFIQQITLTIPAGSAVTVSFLLGDVENEAQLAQLLAELPNDAAVLAALESTCSEWRHQVTAIQVETPSPAIDVMLNGWLIYQTLACRLWGRTAFYQSSGALGFRDQLQDAGAFAQTFPAITREQILLHASRQFVEGDVQHWWHEPPIDSGLRTRFSDDLNWLPYITAHYINTTGDSAILDSTVPFLQGRLLGEGEDEVFERAQASSESASLYEHCCRALDRSLTQGAHGLPLMGTGDWNDGMNRVGRAGRGESVWMAFFLYTILEDFIRFAQQRGDAARAQRYREYRAHLAQVANDTGWDGQWYRRAYYDNGDPLGSAQNDECRIDALAQAWAVLSGVAPPERAALAMAATEAQLIDRNGGLIRLLTPSFVNTVNDPGYIKGYVAGVRENGGQYTHAATWVVKAMAKMGRADCAAPLFEMLLPVTHTRTAVDVERFQAEPYVAVADVYGDPPHVGRGGWSWYTGSSCWLYRVGVESVLGVTLHDGHRLRVQPCIPLQWPGFRMRYRLPQGGVIHLHVERVADSSGCAAANQVVAILFNGQTIAPLNGMAEVDLAKTLQNTTDKDEYSLRVQLV